MCALKMPILQSIVFGGFDVRILRRSVDGATAPFFVIVRFLWFGSHIFRDVFLGHFLPLHNTCLYKMLLQKLLGDHCAEKSTYRYNDQHYHGYNR